MESNKFNPQVEQLFKDLGIPDNSGDSSDFSLSAAYLRYAVSEGAKDAQLLANMSVKMYPHVSDRFGAKPKTIESGIRRFLWLIGETNATEWDKHFGYERVRSNKGNLTNAKVIVALADEVQASLEGSGK